MLFASMPLHHYMVRDVAGSLVAVCVFALVLYAPGYVVCSATDLFGFRKMPFTERSMWAIAGSFCCIPIVAYLIGRAAGLQGVCWMCGALGLVTAWLLSRKGNDPGWSRQDRWITGLVAGCWTILVLLLLIDVQVGHKLYFSVVMADQSYRIAFTDAVVRTGIPPANPLYFGGSPAPMRYYYFWYVLCAAVAKLAHVSARQAFIASSVWAGFGLVVTVVLYTTRFFAWERRKRWLALGLLLVTGADLIPAVGQAVLQPSLNGDTEWWSVDPIDAWPDSLLWVPHHVASALCCLLGFLFLWRTLKPAGRASRRYAVGLAALAFASAFGLSVYVAFGFALLVAAWLVWLLLFREPEDKALLLRFGLAGVLSVFILAPLLSELASGVTAGATSGGANASSHLFTLSVRRLIDSELVTGLPAFAAWKQAHPLLLDQTARAVLLLPGLAMELGLYGFVLVLLLLARRRRGGSSPPDRARDTSLFFSVAGLVMTMFLSSAVITNNDFGYRAVMLPQFFLLLLTADLLGARVSGESTSAGVRWTDGRRRFAYGLLAVGALGTLYWAFLLRAWLPLEVARPQNGFSHLPEDEFQIREAFDVLEEVSPKRSVIAFRPIDPTPDRQGEVMAPNEFYQRMLVMDAGRQMLNAEGKCAIHFGGDPKACAAIQGATTQLYAQPAASAAAAREYCKRFGVQELLISAWDPGFASRTGWPGTLPTLVSEPRLRILQCGG